MVCKQGLFWRSGPVVEISLIRHGETEYNRAFRLQGSLDSPLSELGRQQALRLGRHLASQEGFRSVDAWICSPQGRAVATSDLIRSGLSASNLPEVELESRIVEIHCGRLEGHIMHEVDPEILEKLRSDTSFAYPGGESVEDVMQRARSFWEDLQPRLDSAWQNESRTYRVVIVSHGNFSRCLAAVMLDMPPSFVVRMVLENTGLCYFRSLHEGAMLKLLRWNDRSHMNGTEMKHPHA